MVSARALNRSRGAELLLRPWEGARPQSIVLVLRVLPSLRTVRIGEVRGMFQRGRQEPWRGSARKSKWPARSPSSAKRPKRPHMTFSTYCLTPAGSAAPSRGAILADLLHNRGLRGAYTQPDGGASAAADLVRPPFVNGGRAGQRALAAISANSGMDQSRSGPST